MKTESVCKLLLALIASIIEVHCSALSTAQTCPVDFAALFEEVPAMSAADSQPTQSQKRRRLRRKTREDLDLDVIPLSPAQKLLPYQRAFRWAVCQATGIASSIVCGREYAWRNQWTCCVILRAARLACGLTKTISPNYAMR